MELFVTKLVVSVLTVVILAEIAKRVDPGLSGVLLGLPLGAGLTVYFISLEQGVEFMLAGIPWAIAGLAASLLFCLGYLVAGLAAKGRGSSLAASSLAALAAFLLSGLVIRRLELAIGDAVGLFLVVAAANFWLMRYAPGMAPARKGRALSGRELLLRGVIAGLIICGVTVAAPLAGSRWAGILSSFPSTLYALLVIIHFETGNALYPSIIRNFAHGVTALAVFYLSCRALLPTLGLNLGFLAVYGIAALYLFGLHRLVGKLSSRGA